MCCESATLTPGIRLGQHLENAPPEQRPVPRLVNLLAVEVGRHDPPVIVQPQGHAPGLPLVKPELEARPDVLGDGEHLH